MVHSKEEENVKNEKFKYYASCIIRRRVQFSFAECKSLRHGSYRTFGKILLIKDLKGGYRRRRFARIFYEKLLKFIVEFIDLCVSLSLSPTHIHIHTPSVPKRRKAVSARVIFNYAVRLLEIVIAFETTRSTALLVGTLEYPGRSQRKKVIPLALPRSYFIAPSSLRNLAKVIMKRFLRQAR